MISTRMSGTIIPVVCALTLAACSSGDSPISSPTPPPPVGSATLTWNGPSTNTHSTVLSDLASYHVYRSTASVSYAGSPAATVAAPSTGRGTATATVSNLAPGTPYFGIRAYAAS